MRPSRRSNTYSKYVPTYYLLRNTHNIKSAVTHFETVVNPYRV